MNTIKYILIIVNYGAYLNSSFKYTFKIKVIFGNHQYGVFLIILYLWLAFAWSDCNAAIRS